MRLFFAIQCFFKVLSDANFAARARQLTEEDFEQAESATLPPRAEEAKPPRRSEAIALLAALQREARFVDIVSESLDGYSDAQIGAAARDVLSGCGAVIERLFAPAHVVDAAEGGSVNVPADYDSGRYRLTGNLSQQPPLSGQLMHSGWEATQCELPAWTGSNEAAMVIAPAEVQVG